MAKNKKAQHAAAAKAKKQKVILAVAGVALLGLGVIQGPKLLKHGPPAAAPARGAEAPAATSSATPAGTAVVVPTTSASGPKAILAGVTIENGAAPVLAEGQLLSFSLFDPKDPFVPQASEAVPTAAATATATAKPPAASAGGTTGGTGAEPTVPAKPAQTDATITMNGQAYPLTVKGAFPKAEPLFVLVSLKPKVARIGVAGGSFADGKTMALKLGQKVTLVNDATGARYVLELVYAGTGPEQTENFTQAGK